MARYPSGSGNEYVKERKSYLSGAFVLLLSALLVKCVGMFYKIPLIGTLGGEGMGYFGATYELYALFCVIATAGLPTALSILVSGASAGENGQSAVRYYRTAEKLFFWLGLAGSLILFFGAKVLAVWIRDPGAAPGMRAIAPSFLFVCLGSAVRGYRQGRGEMIPTALSQVIEAMGKLVLGLTFAKVLAARGAAGPILAAGAAAGISCGSAASWLCLLFFRPARGTLEKGKEGETRGKTALLQLLRIAVPVTLSASVLMMTRLSDMFLILRRLQTAGLDAAGANAAYGVYSTMAVPLFAAMPTLLTSLSMALVPALTEAAAKRDSTGVRELIGSALRVTVLCGLPVSLGLSVFARSILRLIFGGTAEVSLASPQLSLLSLSVLLSCLITVTNPILQALGDERRTVWVMLAGGAVKVITAFYLLGLSRVQLAGAPISTFLCDLLITVLNLRRITRQAGRIPLGGYLLRTGGASLVALGAGAVVRFLTAGNGGAWERFGILPALFVTGLVYVLTILLAGILSDEDMRLLPYGEKIRRLVRRVRRVSPERKTGP